MTELTSTPGTHVRFSLRGAIAIVLTLLVLVPAFSRRELPRGTDRNDDDAAVQYLTAVFDDPVARLQKRIDPGAEKLVYDPRHGYLPAVLKALHISPTSQMLVFSKTSFQRDLISPQAPRALYFNDQCYVGWVQGGSVVEVSAVDPTQGAVFYTLSQRPTEHPQFQRQTFGCLQCHSSSNTGNIPGHRVRSVYTRPDGNPDLSGGDYVTTDESPMAKRWGGWYVTGTHGGQRHMGNVIAHGPDGDPTVDREAGANVTDLSRLLDTTPYMTPHSDIVALMLLEHQTHIHNLITQAGYQTRDALRDARHINKLEEMPPDAPRESTRGYIRSYCEPLVRALLFSGAEPLSDPARGTSGYAEQFARPGPRDHQGRSLRDLDLKTRLLRYPCSYLIYSDAFDALPAPAKERVYTRMCEVLSGKDQSAAFAHLSPGDRTAIREILRDTKPDFAAAWKSFTPAPADLR